MERMFLLMPSTRTSTGIKESTASRLPNCPSSLAPQHFTVLSRRIAQVCSLPALTNLTSVIPPTSTGDKLCNRPVSFSVLYPNCPLELLPQQLTVLSLSIAQV